MSAELFKRLKQRYAPEGLAHFGQGKWYPGEPLPRWSLNCFWRKDGEPIWKRAALIADETREYPDAAANAPRLLRDVAERLGVSGEFLFPAYEDEVYYLWRERKLPVNVDRCEERTLGSAVGYVLPLARVDKGSGWRSSPWFLRRERCYLIPGDSPLGFRLPLDSQPWVRPGDFPHVIPEDPTQSFAALEPYTELCARGAVDSTEARALADGELVLDDPAAVVRTSLSAEERHGVLYIFMPPTRTVDEYLEIVAAVEASAQALGQPVILEGYEPPSDPRLVNFKVTPDPGVIEVNVQPSASWEELVALTTHLYETANELKLASEKFMLDGRHVGTGGGNHIVMGGATTGDSPFLRRPDLLRSLISYWHNHPALSYLFSGLSSGRRRRRRAWTKRATTRCMSSSSRSSNSQKLEPKCLRGSWTVCSGIS